MSQLDPFTRESLAATAMAAALGVNYPNALNATIRQAELRSADRYFFHKLASNKASAWMIPIVRDLIRSITMQVDDEALTLGLTNNFAVVGAPGDQALRIYGYRDVKEERPFVQIERVCYAHPPIVRQLPDLTAANQVAMQNHYTHWFNRHYERTMPVQQGVPLSLAANFRRKGFRTIHSQIPPTYARHQICSFAVVKPEEPEAHYVVSFTYDALESEEKQ